MRRKLELWRVTRGGEGARWRAQKIITKVHLNSNLQNLMGSPHDAQQLAYCIFFIQAIFWLLH